MASPNANQGTWAPSSGSFPGTATAIGDYYTATDAGTVDGEVFVSGDVLIAEVATPSTTTFSGNWSKFQVNAGTGLLDAPAGADALDTLTAQVDAIQAVVDAQPSATYYGYMQVSNGASTTNINAATTDNQPVLGTLGLSDSSDFTHDSANNRVTCNFDGVIEVDVSLGVQANTARYNGRLYVTQNGTRASAPGKTGYIRNTSGHNESSMHVNGFLLSVSDGDQISIIIDRESTATGAATQVANETLLSVRRIK